MVALQTSVYTSWQNWSHTGYRAVGLNVPCPRIPQQMPLKLLAAAIVLTATLLFKRGLPPMRTQADLKEITSAVVPLYASAQCQIMVQGTIIKNGASGSFQLLIRITASGCLRQRRIIRVQVLEHLPTTQYNPDELSLSCRDGQQLRRHERGMQGISFQLTKPNHALRLFCGWHAEQC
jgi:hypothetical protein